MSFGSRLLPKEMRLVIGAVYSNDLSPRFEEHRKIETITGDALTFRIIHGPGNRVGKEGSCKVSSFWVWARRRVDTGK